MKRAIRYGVFETNSSSTHSLSFTRNASEKYTLECASPWCRLLVLKALLNAGQRAEEDEEKRFSRADEKLFGILERKGLRAADLLSVFFEECENLYCSYENVKKKDVKEHLTKLYLEHFSDFSYIEERFRFSYDRYGTMLCDCVCGDDAMFCSCLFEQATHTLRTIFGKNNIFDFGTYKKQAREYLYGDRRFFICVYESGVDLIESRLKI